MIQVTVQPDTEQLKQLADDLRTIPGGVVRATVAAVNETGRWARTRVIRAIVAELALKRKDIADKVKLTTANRGAPSATLSVTGKRIPLMAWGARPDRVRNTRRAKSPITYMIKKAEGRKAIMVGFVMELGKSGRRWVMVRKGKPRFPVRAPYGPSIPQVAEDSPETQRIFTVDITDRLRTSLNSKVDWLLNRKRGQPPDAPAPPSGGEA